LGDRFLYSELRAGERVTLVEILTSLAILPFSKVGFQLAFAMASAYGVDPEPKNLSGNLLPELELQQIRINGPVTIFHVLFLFLHSPCERLQGCNSSRAIPIVCDKEKGRPLLLPLSLPMVVA
jgi:hypothetical protein